MLLSDDKMSAKVFDDSQKVWKIYYWGEFLEFDETEEESELDDDIDSDLVPSLRNSKLLIDKIIQVICSLFWRNLHSTVNHHQTKWSREFETGNARIITITINI